jgi:hypothetical protein
MKIGGSSGNNINFIEQKTNISKMNSKQSGEEISSHSESLTSFSLSSSDMLTQNESLGILQTVQSSIDVLKEKNTLLQSIAEKYEYATSEKTSLSQEFEYVIEDMLSVVDSTIYNNMQLFYTNISFNQEQSVQSPMLSDIINIEDLSIEDKAGLNLFDTTLQSIEKDIKSSKEYTELVAFNSLAASSYKAYNTQNTDENTLHVTLGTQELQRAHDVNSLKDKASFLLEG